MSIQQNNNNGDNVAGDKIINQSLTPEVLTDVISNLMYRIATSDYEYAGYQIKSYQNLPTSSIEVQNLFIILNNYVDSLSTKSLIDTSLVRAQLSNNSLIFKELYQAIIIKMIAKTDVEEARKIYDRYSGNASFYLSALYDQIFATKEELQERFDEESLTLDDYLLFGLAVGLWRVENYEAVKKTLERISADKRTEKCTLWLLAADYNITVFKEGVPYPYMSSDPARKMRKIIQDFLAIIATKRSLDPLTSSILIAIVNMFSAYMPEVRSAALRFRKDIAELDVELGEQLNLIDDEKPFVMEDELIGKLHEGLALSKEEMHVCISSILQEVLNVQVVENWFKKSGVILDADEFYNEYMKIFFLSFNKYPDLVQENNYRTLLNDFINLHGSQLKSILPIYIIRWCNNLYSFNKFFEVPIYNILKVVCANIAVTSELYPYYLKSLLRLNKMKTLSLEFNRIQDDEWNEVLYGIQATYFIDTNDYKRAKQVYEKFINNSMSLYNWYNYVFCCSKIDKSLELAKQELKRIPESLFSIDTQGFDFFIAQVANFIDFEFAEKIFVGLFIENPNNYARIIVSLYLNRFSLRLEKGEERDRIFDSVYQGLVYEVDGIRKQGLLVDDHLAPHKDLIRLNTPLGQLLKSLAQGESDKYGFKEVKLIERQEIGTTVFQLSMQIISELQHSFKHVMFHEFMVSEESVVEDVTSILKQMKQNNDFESREAELICNSEIPLYFKGSKLSESRPVDEELNVVYKLLLNKNANTCVTIAGGDAVVTEAVVVDVYSFLYLCLTNLYKSVVASKTTIYISIETKQAIELWIGKVTHDEFMTLNEFNGQLIREDSTTILKSHGSLIDALNELLDYATVENPKITDLPTLISEIKNLVSDSLFSSIKLSLSHDVPWLCLDSFVRKLLAKDKELSLKLVDLHSFIHTHIEYPFLDFNDRKQAIVYWAYSGLYIEYYYSDLIQLVKKKDDIPLLTELLTNTPLNFPDPNVATTILGGLLQTLSFNALLNRDNLSQTVIIEAAIYACMSKGIESLEDRTVEERVAKLAFYMIKDTRIGAIVKYLINLLQPFVWGHFLDIDAINKALDEQRNLL